MKTVSKNAVECGGVMMVLSEGEQGDVVLLGKPSSAFMDIGIMLIVPDILSE